MYSRMEHAALDIDGDLSFTSTHQERSEDETVDLEESSTDPTAERGGSSSRQQLNSSWLVFLTLEYYQTFFDVSTRQVALRILAGMFPVYWILVDTLGKKPDLYGPFWLSVTLIFTTAVSGSLSKLFGNSSVWELHFEKVTQMGTVIFSYIWIVPTCIWAVLWWRGNKQSYSLLQLLAVYGYSMAIFIPLSVLWIINNDILRWVLLAICCVLSGLVLARSLWKPLSSDSRVAAVVILAIVLVLHVGLSVGFKYFYFAMAPGTPEVITAQANNTSI